MHVCMCVYESVNLYRYVYVYGTAGGDLSSHSQRLFQNLQAGFWSRPEWQSFKQEVKILVRSLQKYCDILIAKKQRTFANHHSQQQVRSIENSLTVQFVQQRHTIPSSIQPLRKAVADAGVDTPVSLQGAGVLIEDRKQTYDYIESAKRELDVPIVLVTYSSGGNLVHPYWAWQTTVESINSANQ